MSKRILIACLILCLPVLLLAQSEKPIPTSAQLRWHGLEFYLFMHFGPNTFTDKEWGAGNEQEALFDPVNMDAEQWCKVAKAAGAKGIIITAKHHDGFCLWPSKYSKHTVRESNWRNGKGDVLKDLSAACKKYGLLFGVYISPWDRNHPDYGTERYNDVFVNMIKELFRNYGPIWELWWDGANGEGPNGKRQLYDWKRFEATVRSISPQTVVFSDIGPDVRWCGNESGIAGETNWNMLDTAGFSRGAGGPPQDSLNTGNINGKNWIPAECDVSIRPGWFYHQQQDSLVKTPEELFQLYLKSVGRGANLLLNVPPDRQGLIHADDVKALVGFARLKTAAFQHDLAKQGTGYVFTRSKIKKVQALNDGDLKSFQISTNEKNSALGISFKKAEWINCVVLNEFIAAGQHCKGFLLQLKDEQHTVLKEIRGTTIGNKRIICFPAMRVADISLIIDDQMQPTLISEIAAYRLKESLIQ